MMKLNDKMVARFEDEGLSTAVFFTLQIQKRIETANEFSLQTDFLV